MAILFVFVLAWLPLVLLLVQDIKDADVPRAINIVMITLLIMSSFLAFQLLDKTFNRTLAVAAAND